VVLVWAAGRRPDRWWNVRTTDGAPDTQCIERVHTRFRSIRTRTPAVAFDDGPFARLAANDRILGPCAGCTAERLPLARADLGGRPLGYLGFCRRSFRSAPWPRVLAWIRTP
jgi:predicted alpha/beta hydrolase